MNTMKTENKKTGRKALPLRDHRWQWMAAAAAGTAAGVTAAQAGDVTIPLSGNYISAAAGNHLNLDLAGDGYHNTLTKSDSTNSSFQTAIGTHTYSTFVVTFTGTDGTTFGTFEHFTTTSFARIREAGVKINGERAFGWWSGTSSGSTSASNGFNGSTFDTEGPRTWTVDFTFNGDPDINGGASTPATLTLETIAEGPGNVAVELVSYTYNQTVALTPYQMLEEAKSEIEGALPAIKGHTVRPKITPGFTPLDIAGLQAFEELNRIVILENFEDGGTLLNPARGQAVYEGTLNAVEVLLPYSRGESPLAVEVRSIIELITQADIDLADNAYTDAIGLTTRQADNALDALDDAEDADSDGLYIEAITDANNAWRYVEIP
jgi:hypothetical protein